MGNHDEGWGSARKYVADCIQACLIAFVSISTLACAPDHEATATYESDLAHVEDAITAYIELLIQMNRMCGDVYGGALPRYGDPAFTDMSHMSRFLGTMPAHKILSSSTLRSLFALRGTFISAGQERGKGHVDMIFYCRSFTKWGEGAAGELIDKAVELGID